MIMSDSESRPWLLIEALQESVLRFATAMPSARPRLSDVREINIAGLPTFTDALQQYERESGIPLQGRDCAMAIAGAASGEAFSLARSRWTISRAGLAAIFGRPVTIINGVAARAWAIKSGSATVDALRGARSLNLANPGRYIMLSLSSGVGASVVDVDRDGLVRILETEAGQMDFPAESEREHKLVRSLKGLDPHVTWENLLKVDPQSPVWAQACPEVSETDRARMVANVLGRFAVNLLYAYGAWDGVMITGSRGAKILDPLSRSAFDSAFAERRSLHRLVSSWPAWKIEQREPVLTGAAECLAQSAAGQMRRAA
jgi:glucokinase